MRKSLILNSNFVSVFFLNKNWYFMTSISEEKLKPITC